eukprot:COSAG03_NODE_2799_length_2447_cov_1.654174_1_plen_40_part_00
MQVDRPFLSRFKAKPGKAREFRCIMYKASMKEHADYSRL